MARSTAEIQADIAVTRGLIEHRLDELRSAAVDRWWMPPALVVGGLLAGMMLSRFPLLRLVTLSARMVEAGLSVASVVAAVGAVRRRRLG